MEQPTTPSTAIAAPAPAGDLINTPDRYAQALEHLRANYNVIAPPVQMMGLFSPGYVMVASAVKIDATITAEGQGTETYFDRGFMKAPKQGDNMDLMAPGAQRALNRVGLNKIASAAGVKWTPNCGRRDDGKTQYLWQYYAEGIVDTADGSYQIITGEIEIDLRDGSAQIGEWTAEKWAALTERNRGKQFRDQEKSINGWSDKRLMQARTRGLALAETKAKNRAIRSLGLQQSYTVAELQKPFLIFRAQYVPDMSDPVIRQMVAHRALHGRQILYPQLTAPVPARQDVITPIPPAGTIDAETVDHTADPEEPLAPSRVSQSTQTTTAPAAETKPEPKVLVASIGEKTGVTNGHPWTKFIVTFSTGEQGSTLDSNLAGLAKECYSNQYPVDYVIEDGKYGKELVELRRSQQGLPL